ncbi:MAG TPA: AAA family ATPase [Patescibacteria group bacterium]|nr:AAA family ATPase [Patescibacteria group bacterium]
MSNKLPKLKYKHGLVFGKFMPLHEGHLHLLRFARSSCEKLTILVCSLPTEPIPGDVRFAWVKEAMPDAEVIHHDDIIPQEPSEHPNFWQIWHDSIRAHCPHAKFDALFGSEDYGWKMAEVMGIEYVPVNRLRTLVPISGTEVRRDPMKAWSFIPSVARPYFVKRVRIVGPESSGKSTLTIDLAREFETVFVEEYARGLLDEYVAHREYKPGEVRYEDISTIGRGQLVSEESMARIANRVLFCDTDLMTTVFWSNFYFGRCPGWIAKKAQERKYDLTLLLSPDVPWIQDAQRPMPDLKERQAFFNWWEAELKRRDEPYVVIRGDWKERWISAVKAVEALGVRKTAARDKITIK